MLNDDERRILAEIESQIDPAGIAREVAAEHSPPVLDVVITVTPTTPGGPSEIRATDNKVALHQFGVQIETGVGSRFVPWWRVVEVVTTRQEEQ